MGNDLKVILKKGKERIITSKHPWIFSGAIQEMPSFENGSILPVHSAEGKFQALAYFNKDSNITGRILSFEELPIKELLKQTFKKAKAYRNRVLEKNVTTGYRLINAEGDGCPGLIVDVYEDIYVIQVSTLGMEKLKPLIVSLLVETFKAKGVYEKSDSQARKLEGLSQPQIGWLHGKMLTHIQLEEHGLKYSIELEKSQKTGFFLDQRNMRHLVGRVAKDLKVLNCFAYNGGFSFNALKGGAAKVISVDSSESACEMMKAGTKLNHLDRHEIVHRDVFKYLLETEELFDFIILDPPAYAKKKHDLPKAFKHYRELNQLALKRLKPSGFLLTCSCSYYMDEVTFEKMVYESLLGSSYHHARVVSKHLMAEDHPFSLYHPEGKYLKSLLLELSN